jgi:uncharacterized protein
MTLDEIVSELKSSDRVPDAALTAAVPQANALAPIVFAAAAKLCRGVYLMPGEAELLYNGLHALAAARHPELCSHLIALARQPEADLELVLGDRISITLGRLMLSVWDREPSELFRLIEHADLEAEPRWALYDILGRLTFDGRIPRAETAAFLAHLEQHGLIDDEDTTWWGWHGAVVRLGLVELDDALRRVLTKDAYADFTDADRAELIAALHATAAAPADPAPFDDDEIRPVTDPVEAMSWIARRNAALAEWRAEDRAAPQESDDVANELRLTGEEMRWLSGLLSSRQMPPSAMSLEMLDGYLTALTIGPAVVSPATWLPAVWGMEDDPAPTWDTPEQAEYTLGLMTKHANAIAARCLADAPHRPLIDAFNMAVAGEEWADGFLHGLDSHEAAWEPLLADPRADRLLGPIELLVGTVETPTRADRERILAQLPETLRRIAVYWKAPALAFPSLTPVRSTKIGRNDPCPCGSGSKFKKCCGSGPPPALH